MGETSSITDRRAARASRTRDSVVDALLELIDEGNLRPTAREIAARANVSLRSVYVHFDDVDALFRAAAVRHNERLDAVRGELVTEGTFEERLVAFLDRRVRVYELGRNVVHAAVLLEPFSPAMRGILEQGRRKGWAELEQVFAPELSRAPSASAAVAALDVLVGGKAWEVLRHHHGLPAAEARDVMCTLVRAFVRSLVDPDDGGTASREEGASLM